MKGAIPEALYENTELEELHCDATGLAAVDVSNNPRLKLFSCSGNSLTALDLSANTELAELYCYGNGMTVLDLSANGQLVSIDCSKNNLVWLNIDNCGELIGLNCTNNNIARLNTGGCPKLVNFMHDDATEIVSYHVDNPLESGATLPSILTRKLNAVRAGVQYRVQLIASGTSPITWSVSKGKLPAGFSLSASGLLTGTAEKKLTGKFTVKAENSAGSDTADLTLSSFVAPEISTASLKDATTGKAYSFTIRTRTGTKPFRWSAEGLPNGLTINAKTGRISGKPSVSGTFSVTVTAENDAGTSAKTLKLNVKGVAPTLSGSFAKADLNQPYSSGLKVKGTEPIAWSIEGDLPEGLTFDIGTGIISGIPNSYGKKGVFKFTVTAENSAGRKSKKITFTVKGKQPTVTTTVLDDATQGASYSFTLQATGSTPITWTATGLPSGLDIDGTTGTISGTTNAAAKIYSVRVTAENIVGKKPKTLKLKVKAASDTRLPVFSAPDDSKEASSSPETGQETRRVPPENEALTEAGGYIIVGELGVISADEAGMYEFGIALNDDAPEGWKLIYMAGSDNPSDDDEIAEFYDETGEEIFTVPESRLITISIWLNPGTVYKPQILATRN